MKLRERLAIGCLGASAPILVNLCVVDLNTALKDVHLLDGLSYVVRLFALCASACMVVYLNSDERRPAKLFQLGVMAPAFLTGLINGASLSAKSQDLTAAQSKLQSSPSPTTYVPSFLGIAFAQPTPSSDQPIPVKDCDVPRAPSAIQQILKGLIGLVPLTQWFVVVGSYQTQERATDDANEIRTRYAERFPVTVCKPLGGSDVQYRVVIGEKLSYADAMKLRGEALSAGLPSNTWLWNGDLTSITIE